MVGEVHCHTNLSLPHWVHRKLPTPIELVDHAVSLGLDFLAITDHDVQSAFDEVSEYALSKGLVLIPSVEISTKNSKFPHKRPHILAYGVTEKIKSRQSIDETIAAIHAQNGLAVAAHPFCTKYSRALYVGESVMEHPFDGIEVFNAGENNKSNEQAYLLAQKQPLLQFAGSDAHELSHVGHARITLSIEHSRDWRELLHAMREGAYELVLTAPHDGKDRSGRIRSSSLSFIYRSLRGKAS